MGIVKSVSAGYGVKEMCLTLGVHRNNYYRWLKNPEDVRKKQDRELKPKIKQEFADHRMVYGATRMAEILRKKGIPFGKPFRRHLI